jgi:hypothetical protein
MRAVRQRWRKMMGVARSLIPVCFAMACSSSSDPGTDPNAQGVVVGFVRDTTGQGVSGAIVCAVAVFEVNGTPVILGRQAPSGTSGAYQIPMSFPVQADVRAGLTIAATPKAASGLEPALRSGLTILIAATPPPAETTHADLEVRKGTPSNGVFCASGP